MTLTSQPSGNDDEPTRDRILRVAAHLFAEHGYHATSMANLCDGVGLQRGALYYYIGSKEQLLYEISSRHVSNMVDYGERLLKEDVSSLQKFLWLSTRLLNVIHDTQDEVTVFFQEIGALTGERRRRVFQLRDQFEDVWARILDQGVNDGLLNRSDPLFIKAILGMHNYSYIWLKPHGALRPEDVALYFCDLIFGTVLTDSGLSEYQTLTKGTV